MKKTAEKRQMTSNLYRWLWAAATALALITPLNAHALYAADWTEAWNNCEAVISEPEFCYTEWPLPHCLPARCNTTNQWDTWYSTCVEAELQSGWTVLSSNMCWITAPAECPGDKELISGECQCAADLVEVSGACVEEPECVIEICLKVGSDLVPSDGWNAAQTSRSGIPDADGNREFPIIPTYPTENTGCRCVDVSDSPFVEDFVIRLISDLQLSGMNDLTVLMVDSTGEPLSGPVAGEMFLLNEESPPEIWGREQADVSEPGEFTFDQPYNPVGSEWIDIHHGFEFDNPGSGGGGGGI